MVKCTARGLVVKRPGVLSKVQMLTLVLRVGVFSLLPSTAVLFGQVVGVNWGQRIAKGAGGKGPRQKTSKSVKKFFDTFRQFSRRAKNVKNRRKVSKSFSTLFDNFRAAPFFRPLLRSADAPRTLSY